MSQLPPQADPQHNTLSRDKLCPERDEKLFPVVGIGASAGGLDALEQFFSTIPLDSGMAFVVITHLDVERKSLMPELLRAFTPMPVMVITDKLIMTRNTVYVLPPNKNASMINYVLCLDAQDEPHFTNLPINFFFHALAHACHEHAIAVILSGLGHDGSLGLREVKQQGGIVLVQDPSTAKYDGMPISALATGLVDYVGVAASLFVKSSQLLHDTQLTTHYLSSDLWQIFSLLQAKTGHDFSGYKLNVLKRRIEKQMRRLHIDTLVNYVSYLRLNLHEVDRLFSDLLISVTRFFRDPGGFEFLKHHILPKLMHNKPSDYVVRIWVPGCATGEEVYSLAILMQEYMDEVKHGYRVQIFGTDIDLIALDTARASVYPQTIEHDVSVERLERFFIQDKKQYKIKKELREMVVFGAQDLIQDPPFTKVDLISCRNVLIYIDTPTQQKLFTLFHFSLKPAGILLLGMSESASRYANLFISLDKKYKFYQREELVGRLSTPYMTHHSRIVMPWQKISQVVISRKLITPEVIEAPCKAVIKTDPLSEKTHCELQVELQFIKENLQATIEELETSNEEMQSTNEELQSINEELETSKEESQSVNEELIVVNNELQNRIEQIAAVNDDMNNLFNSAEIAAFFLDSNLHVKRFTPKAHELIPLIPADIGRSFRHFATNLLDVNLVARAEAVLANLVPQLFDAQATNKRWYSVHIFPYRTVINTVDGVVITMTDITLKKQLETQVAQHTLALNYTRGLSEQLLDTVHDACVIFDETWVVRAVNRVFLHQFKYCLDEVQGKSLLTIDHNAWDTPALRHRLKQVQHDNLIIEGVEFVHVSSCGEVTTCTLNARSQPGFEEQPWVFVMCSGSNLI